MTDQEKIKTTLSAIFRRKGKDGRYTRLFDNLESAQKNMLLQNIQLNESELPIIGSVESKDKWLLITTTRLIWCLGHETQTIPVEVIRDVVADFRKLVTTGRKKSDMTELQILTTGGGQHIIEMEKGAPLVGAWNALKNLGARNRRDKQKQITNNKEI